MDEEKLIELVRANPPLFDFTNEKYVDSKYKNNIWKRIAQELNLFDDDSWKLCKSKWTNIRDTFKKSLAKRKAKIGQSAKKMKLYRYEQRLQFLLPNIEDRDTIDSILLSLKSQSSTISCDQQDVSITDLNDNREQNLEANANFALENSAIPNPPTIKRCKKRPAESATTTLMQYILENKRRRQTKEDDKHPMDAFLEGIAPTLKKFSPYYQHIAKGRIFSVVHEIELQEIMSNTPSGSPSTSQISSQSANEPENILPSV